MARRMIGVSDMGHPVGEDHHRARLTNAEVDQMRDMRDAGMMYKDIARHFGVPITTVASICLWQRRVATAVAWRAWREKKGRQA